MTIQVFPFNQQEEDALLDFLKTRHYSYKSAGEDELPDTDFLNRYKEELNQAGEEIDKGNFVTHHDAKTFFEDRRKRLSGN